MLDVLETALQGQGLWAITSVSLVLYVLKKTDEREKRSAEREEKHLTIIESFKESFGQLANAINIIKLDVDIIKDKIDDRGDK